MAEFSFPFTGGAGGDDGPYSATFFSGMLSAVFGQDNVARNDASVILRTDNGTDDALEVTETSPQSNEIEVKEGKALIKGYYYYNDSDLNLTVTANNDGSGFSRIDTVVLEIDFINQVVTAKIVTGTPAGVPVAPTLTKNSTIYQVPIANITVANLFTVITNANIDNSVKIPYVLWDVTQGGTGLTSVIAGEVITGNGTNTMGKVTAAVPDYANLVTDKTLATKSKWVGNRPTVLRGSGTAIGSATTLVPFSSADWTNPDSYITQLSSNLFRFAVGIYKITGNIAFATSGASITAGTLVGAWLADSAATTTALAASTTQKIENTGVADSMNLIFIPQIFTVTSSTTDYGIYVRRTAAGGTVTMLSSTAALATSSTIFGRVISFERIG